MAKNSETEEEMWYLIYCEEDDSFSIVDEGKVIASEDGVRVGDAITFTYGPKSFIGVIKSRNGNREVLNMELKKIGRKASRKVKKTKKSDEPVEEKRIAVPPKRFVPNSASTPAPKAKRRGKCSKSIARDLKAAGASAMGKKLISELEESQPFQNMEEQSSSESDNELLIMMKEKTKQRKELLKSITTQKESTRDPTPTNDNVSKPQISKSPSKEELKRLYLQAQEKIRMLSEDALKIEERLGDVMEIETSTSGFEKNTNKSLCNHSCTEPSITGIEENSNSSSFKFFHSEPSTSGFEKNKKLSNTEDHELDPTYSPSSTRKEVADESFGNMMNIEKSFEDKSTDDFSFLEDRNLQLFGENCPGHQMVRLSSNIYCKKSVLNVALKQASNTSQLVRRLLTGVFKEEAIVSCTLTGQRPRAAGRNNYCADTEVSGLHSEGVDAILKFAKKYGAMKQWEKLEDKDLRKSVTQRIGEITRKAKGKEKNGDGTVSKKDS